MEEKKLSEELRRCLESNGCCGCEYYDVDTKLACKSLLQKAHEVVNRYEEMEERGKLRIFPCSIGDTVYRINKGAKQPIIPLQVLNFKIFNNNLVESFKMECADEWDGGYSYRKTDIGRNVFLTKSSAEQALKENGLYLGEIPRTEG